MKKYIKLALGLTLLVTLVISSCKKDQIVEDPISPDGYPKVTLTPNIEGTTMKEGDTLIYTITLDKPIDRSLTFSATIVGGEGTEDDIEALPATIPAYETETQLSIIFFEDWEVDPDETISIEIGIKSLAEKYLVNPATPAQTFNFTVTNYVGSDDLLLTFDWDKDIDLGFGVYPTSVNVDFDIFMSDGASFDIANPWATANFAYYAATGSHPEEILITAGSLPDGDYVFWFDLWANGFWGYGNTTLIPVHTTAAKQGLINVTVEQNPDEVINADTPGFDDDGTSTNGYLCKVNVSGTTYTVSGWDGTVAATGKSTVLRTERGFTKNSVNMELRKN